MKRAAAHAVGMIAAGLWAAAAMAQPVAQTAVPVPESQSTPAPQPVAPKPRVMLATDQGAIVIELESEHAPVTAGNFLKYVDGKRLDGTVFYRAMKVGGDAGLVQGGVRGDPKRVLPKIVHEATTATGLSHTDGAISMARGAPGSADGDFFIVVGDLAALDAKPGASGDTQGFAVFGRVVEGMDVVRRMLAAPTSPTEGEGVMKGQMLSPAIRLVTARRLR